MYMSEQDRDRFVAETALHKGVDVDELLAMEADSYTGILKNAEELVKRANKTEIPTCF